MQTQFTPESNSPRAGNNKGGARGKSVLCALLFAGSVAAQVNPNTITEPVLGMVFDAQGQSVRALMGIPAASRVGGAVDSGAPLGAAAISSEWGYALALEASTGAAVLVSQSGRQPLPGVRAGAQRAALSPHGTAAALYFADSGKASILTGLPDAPQVLREVTLDGAPSLVAVSDDGSTLAAVISLTAAEATVFYYPADGGGQSLLRDRHFPSVEFVPGTTNLLIAQDTAVNLYQSRQGLQVLTDQRDGIASVVGAAASADGARVVIAMRGGQVAVRNLAAATQTVVSCSCEPAGMWRLRGKAVFRLNELGSGPIWVVDGDAPAPRILFVAMPVGDNR